MLALLLLALASSSSDELFAPSDERFQALAQRIMGGKGCPDVAPGPPPSSLVATLTPHLSSGTPKKLLVDIRYTNSGAGPVRLQKRYLVDGERTDTLWIYDRASKRWLDYVGPHGRPRRPRAGDHVVIAPGKSKDLNDVDVTRLFAFPKSAHNLVAKVLFEPAWESGPRIESKCVALPALE